MNIGSDYTRFYTREVQFIMASNFPLFLHTTGQWAKKVRGRTRYFGRDRDAALNLWLDQRDDLLAGRNPGPRDGVTIEQLVNNFLADCAARVESAELQPRTLADYNSICNRVLKVLGHNSTIESLRPEDFTRLKSNFAKTHGPVALLGDITRVRRLFNFGGIQPAYGTCFAKPSSAVLRRDRSTKPKKLFAAAEIIAMIDKATPMMKAMIYLGINCGFGPDDCARLEPKHVKAGWHHLPRHKTGIDRRCPLWKETQQAISHPI